MNEKKIEPTAAMVRDVECWRSFTGTADRTPLRPILRAALNHYDAPGLFADEDDRPWGPLDVDDQVRVGDEVRQDRCGVIRTAVVARVDKDGGPWTAEGGFIGLPGVGTWSVRRTVQELPTEPGSVIVPADGRDYIEATLWGETFYARAALRSWTDWHAAWRAGERKCGLASSGEITPGTWKVDDQ